MASPSKLAQRLVSNQLQGSKNHPILGPVETTTQTRGGGQRWPGQATPKGLNSAPAPGSKELGATFEPGVIPPHDMTPVRPGYVRQQGSKNHPRIR